MTDQKGFSLIELLIVVAIILIIAAIAIPNLLHSRMAANEASAVGSLRSINTAQVTYFTTFPTTGYTQLSALGGAAPCTPGPATACILDPIISAGGPKSGYNFVSVPAANVPATTFGSNANPQTFGTTGARNFYSDNGFTITYTTNGVPAGPLDKILQ
jgi:prepilin-type N-terminal cleavage/methylation domain-containing protein